MTILENDTNFIIANDNIITGGFMLEAEEIVKDIPIKTKEILDHFDYLTKIRAELIALNTTVSFKRNDVTAAENKLITLKKELNTLYKGIVNE